MTRREAWLSVGAVFALALVVRAVAAATLSFPVPRTRPTTPWLPATWWRGAAS